MLSPNQAQHGGEVVAYVIAGEHGPLNEFNDFFNCGRGLALELHFMDALVQVDCAVAAGLAQCVLSSFLLLGHFILLLMRYALI